MRRLYACSFSSGARETQTQVRVGPVRKVEWKPLKPSAIDEHEGQPASNSGPNMKW